MHRDCARGDLSRPERRQLATVRMQSAKPSSLQHLAPARSAQTLGYAHTAECALLPRVFSLRRNSRGAGRHLPRPYANSGVDVPSGRLQFRSRHGRWRVKTNLRHKEIVMSEYELVELGEVTEETKGEVGPGIDDSPAPFKLVE